MSTQTEKNSIVVDDLIALCSTKAEEGSIKDAKEAYKAAVDVAAILGVSKPAMPSELELLLGVENILSKTITNLLHIAVNAHNNRQYDYAKNVYDTARMIANVENVSCRRIQAIGNPEMGTIAFP